MNCPTCNKPMRKVRWEITNNLEVGEQHKEYDKLTFTCTDDDVWVTTEIPAAKKQPEKPAAP